MPRKRRVPSTSEEEEEEEEEVDATFAAECDKLFGCTNLYDVIGVDGDHKAATASTIKRAYYKSSMQYHPDRSSAEDKTLSTHKFQALSKAYGVLGDEEQRAIYDETGSIADAFLSTLGKHNFADDWHALFDEITDFATNYKDSAEERAQIVTAYEKSKGNLGDVIDGVMCASMDDEERISNIIHDLIVKEEVEPYRRFTHETVKQKKERRAHWEEEAQEAAEHFENIKKTKKKGASKSTADLGDLAMAIRERQSNREESFLEKVEKKYWAPAGKKVKKVGKK